VLWVEPDRLIEPERATLFEAIRASDAMRFVSDPQGFFERRTEAEESG
jgi:hypothetical protein